MWEHSLLSLAYGVGWELGCWWVMAGALFLKQMCPCATVFTRALAELICGLALQSLDWWVQDPGFLFIRNGNREQLINQFTLTSFHSFTNLQ